MSLFRENHLLEKEEIMYSLEKYIEYLKKDYKKENYSKIRRDNIIELCLEFKNNIENTRIPKITDKWYFYEYSLCSDGMILNLNYCEDIEFDNYSQISNMNSIEVFELMKIECQYLTIEEFSSMYSVKKQTVNRWIVKGKLRSAKICNDNWKIPKICDRPKKNFESVNYYWNDNIKIENSEFKFLNECNHIYIYQGNSKLEYKINIYSYDQTYIDTLVMIDKDREKLEYILICNPEIIRVPLNEGIRYIPAKKMQNKINYIENFSNHSDEKNRQEPHWLEYGKVIVTNGKHRGRIGYFDGEADDYVKGVVYWGDPCLCRDHYELIKMVHLSNYISTLEMLTRIKVLNLEIAQLRIVGDNYYLCTQLLSELLFITDILTNRYINITYLQKEKDMKVFISHATRDLEFARALATDIMDKGYNVFLDDWSIDLGENIINKINEGLEESQILIPIISESFIESVFCLDEWTSFYMRFAKTRQNSILPLLIDETDIPTLLSAIKYFRFTDGESYRKFLTQLGKALKKHEGN